MKHLLSLIFLILVACSNLPEDYCQQDTDCIPKPGCHVSECINKDLMGHYDNLEICREQLPNCSAAYVPDDCLCIDNRCTNKNLGDRGCPGLGVRD